jgi:DHA1 family chloramphenicol resistance protein-like MFS transporter
MIFGVGSFAGVTVAGRFSDTHSQVLIVVGGTSLVIGWIAMALTAANPVFLLGLVFTQGLLGFAVGSTLITRVLYMATGAPTMGGSYATAALNAGATAGPLLGAFALGMMPGALGPVWVAVTTSGAATLLAMVLRDQTVPRQ